MAYGHEEILDRVFATALSEQDEAALRAALEEGDGELATRVAGLLRRFSLLVEVVNILSESRSLDAQLPRLMNLITGTLDAERATLFLLDPETGELFSRVANGDGVAEIRVPAGAGIVGSVMRSGQPEIVPDAYLDPRFNPEVDRRTGFHTRSILAAPLRKRSGQVIGVTQVLNKRRGPFDANDLALIEAISSQAMGALDQARALEQVERARLEESLLLEISEAISSDLQLDTLLGKIVTATTRLLDAERSTLFLHDPSSDELWSLVAEGSDTKEIRIPANAGIAGAAFGSGQVQNIADAYADPRFNQDVDRRTGYRTRNILCLPVADKFGVPLGVVQVLNKRGGSFNALDEKRLKAFSAQIAISIHNARLFTDVLELKNYNESILKSLTNGVVTLDRDMRISKVNEAACRILRRSAEELVERSAEQVFGNANGWVTKSLEYVRRTDGSDYHADTDLLLDGGDEGTSVNMTAAPLFDIGGKPLGSMLVFEDITREKRVRGTMARYMAKEVVDRLLESGQDMMLGSSQMATVLFSDIRRFTTLAEALSAQETVAMLNEYFTEMVDVIFQHGGILDKYIGDAIMAVFGAPITTPLDAEHAVTVAVQMIRALNQLNQRRSGDRVAPIEIGIGLATGEVLAGSIGSVKRLDYTVIGDSVNLAARLESANKYYGTSILIAGSTIDALKTRPQALRRIDFIQVKGKTHPVPVYEVLDFHTEESFPHLPEVLAAFEAGMVNYRQADWSAAIEGFEAALALAPQDVPSRIFIDRCRYYREIPPPDGWNGVWVMNEK